MENDGETNMLAERQQSAVGVLIREWRNARGLSQLDLAIDANMSARHLSFLETGRASPSRDTVANLATALRLTETDRRALLAAAGFPQARLLDYQAPQMAATRHAVDLILRANEPYCAAAVDRHWNIIAANNTYWALTGDTPSPIVGTTRRPNMLHRFFAPSGMRASISNWDNAAYQLIQRLHREAIAELRSNQTGAGALLDELMHDYSLPARWKLLDVSAPMSPALKLHLSMGEQSIRLLTAITTLGTPLDAEENEIRIEAFLPMDEESRDSWHNLIKNL